MRQLVIDASVALSWLLADEHSAQSRAMWEALADADAAWVPSHWLLELANSFWVAERRKRLDATSLTEALELLQELPVTADRDTSAHATQETLALARKHDLSVYDCAYLELALRKGAALATFDAALGAVAQASGVAVLGLAGRS